MGNVIIGLGNTGTSIVKLIANTPSLSDVELYAIDSVYANISMNDINRIKYFSIVSDDKTGSGRSRERGEALYKFHENQGDFKEMYETCKNAKSPVIVITSSAGGTGSGSCRAVCESIVKNNVQVLPVIVCPNKNDPDAYHLNTYDLLIDLGNIIKPDGTPGITGYSIFENKCDGSNYEPVNKEIVEMIEIILGKKYEYTDQMKTGVIRDTIDDSDLDSTLGMPGRMIVFSATAPTKEALKQEIGRKLYSCYQPAYTSEDCSDRTVVTACSLKSMFADNDIDEISQFISEPFKTNYDRYKHVIKDNNNGLCTATVIIAGLARSGVKEITASYDDVSSISTGIQRSKRPGFVTSKKTMIRDDKKPASTGHIPNTKDKYVDWGE